MKITISSNHKKEVTTEDVIARINDLTSAGFARLADDQIILQSCSNSHRHNRIVVLLIIFFDQNHKNNSYANIGLNDGVALILPIKSRSTFLTELLNKLNQIDRLQDLEITIE